MSWREELRVPMWKGLPFRLSETELNGGWNIDEKTIPVQETASTTAPNKEAEQQIKNLLRKDARGPKVTDTSKKVKVFNVSMHFIGDDYLIDLDAMIKLLDEGGQGDLVLPTRGKIKAIAGEYRNGFDNTTGGFETLEVQFFEVSSEPQVRSRTDTDKQLSDSATAAKDEVEGSFGYKSTSAVTPGPNATPEIGIPDPPSADFVLEAAEELALKLPDSLFNEIGLGEVNDTVNGYVKRLDDYRDAVKVLVRKPDSYVEEIRGLTEGLTTIFNAPRAAFDASKRIYDRFENNLKLIFPTTPDREQEKLNQESVVFSVKSVAAIGMATSAAAVQFQTSQDVTELIEIVVDALDDLALEIGDSQQRQELFDSLNDVKTKFLVDISSASADLPGIKNITTSLELPAVVIAYDLYADANRQDEIIERNKVENPLFCPTELEVLSF